MPGEAGAAEITPADNPELQASNSSFHQQPDTSSDSNLKDGDSGGEVSDGHP